MGRVERQARSYGCLLEGGGRAMMMMSDDDGERGGLGRRSIFLCMCVCGSGKGGAGHGESFVCLEGVDEGLAMPTANGFEFW